jgi:cytochrome c oxidase assembly protein subunit 15
MNSAGILQNNRQVANWLLIGVFMIMVQVLIGGITRLTESGLSITEWKPITGALPPLTEAQWAEEFEKYRTTDQFQYVHRSFDMGDFKFIYFWEWFHRLWARFMGLVFLTGFTYFIFRKKLTRNMIAPLVALFILGGLQGAIGWIMVKSGLVPEKYYVGHVELTTHFIAAVLLLCYTLWFAVSLKPSFDNKVRNNALKNLLHLLTVLFLIQFMYGGFMAGMKAAATAPTWPDINGDMIPSSLSELQPWYHNLFNNKIMVHFIHRGWAYLILILVSLFFIKSRKTTDNRLFTFFSRSLLSLIFVQVILGILTVMNGTFPERLVWLGTAHQFAAILLACNLTALQFLVRKNGI